MGEGVSRGVGGAVGESMKLHKAERPTGEQERLSPQVRLRRPPSWVLSVFDHCLWS